MRLRNINKVGSIGLQLFNDYRRYTLFAGQSISVEGGKDAEDYYRENYGPIGVEVIVEEVSKIITLEPESIEPVPELVVPELVPEVEVVVDAKEEVVVEEKKTQKKSTKKQQK